MLLDTASLYFRAFFGMPDSLRAPDGTPVNAVRGLLDFIARLVSDYAPSHLVCCWDNDWRPTWRVELLPSYKEHRLARAAGGGGVDAEEVPDALAVQVPVIAEVLAAMGIAVRGVDGYEADDVIGTLATTAGMPADVVTGDRDLFQLVDDEREIRVLYTARGVGRHEQVTGEVVRAKYGVRADQYADFATLRGDASDGLPGVKGVGDKTAARLLAEFGTLAGIRAAAADPSTALAAGVRANLLAAAGYLDVAPRVVEVTRTLPIPADWGELRRPHAFDDEAAVTRLADTWGLGGSVARVRAALAADHD
ncbi:flap endonuclease [Pseudactinotalea sp. HY160]|uniref:5'-3' exonuclease n=1 Tax=Pseudactinotalea sp. HY160 TaxID=2654490 RepID=UPI00128DE54B|nr:5'-3' exonuclease [Pseudactinotalea sp. HY160]MPV49863.1 flap endonuclease [Pseudactinotalea sp. HY160]